MCSLRGESYPFAEQSPLRHGPESTTLLTPQERRRFNQPKLANTRTAGRLPLSLTQDFAEAYAADIPMVPTHHPPLRGYRMRSAFQLEGPRPAIQRTIPKLLRGIVRVHRGFIAQTSERT